MLVLNGVVLIWVLGLVLWLTPWPPKLTVLHEPGRWIFLIAFSVWLGLFH